MFRRTNAIIPLFELALNDTNQCFISPILLFWLADCVPANCTVENLRKRYQLFRAAFVRYKAVLMTSSERREKLLAELQDPGHSKSWIHGDDIDILDCPYEDSTSGISPSSCHLKDGVISLRQVTLLAGLACKIDQEERKASHNEDYMATVNCLFQLILDEWIDPLLSFNVLIMVRLFVWNRGIML